ncbi:MAG TPA: cytochrome C oxidase subunit IV family protein [Vicinamibacterales bacterium]|nr:cytochrome C oxidase subunit IV family protein [Vicinamibacterales bacterium]
MSGHIASRGFYVGIWITLLILTFLTAWVAEFDLGAFNNVVMLAIACTKASLVILFFMHVRWSTRLTWVVAGAGFFWLLIFFSLGMNDYLSRGWVQGTLR